MANGGHGMDILEAFEEGYYVVYNRNGHLIIDSKGVVIDIYIDDGVEDFTGNFRHITRVDLDEWQRHWTAAPPNELDILDVAYWYKPPDEPAELYHPADQEGRDERAEWKRNEHRTS
jgi:hypothetical protein